jgi:hypothetical protein
MIVENATDIDWGFEAAIEDCVPYWPTTGIQALRWRRIDQSLQVIRQQHDVTIEVWWSQRQGYVQCVGNRSYHMVIPTLEGAEHELLAYHEMGHVVRRHFEPGAPYKSTIDCEIEAWEWALRHMRKIAPSTARRYERRFTSLIASALCTYLLHELEDQRTLPHYTHPVWGWIRRSESRIYPPLRGVILEKTWLFTGRTLPHDASLQRVVRVVKQAARR